MLRSLPQVEKRPVALSHSPELAGDVYDRSWRRGGRGLRLRTRGARSAGASIRAPAPGGLAKVRRKRTLERVDLRAQPGGPSASAAQELRHGAYRVDAGFRQIDFRLRLRQLCFQRLLLFPRRCGNRLLQVGDFADNLILVLLSLGLLLHQPLIRGQAAPCPDALARRPAERKQLSFRLGPRELKRQAHNLVGQLTIGADIHFVICVGDEFLLRTELVIPGNRLIEELHHARSIDGCGDRGGPGRRNVLARRLRRRLSGPLRGTFARKRPGRRCTPSPPTKTLSCEVRAAGGQRTDRRRTATPAQPADSSNTGEHAAA